MGAARVFRRQRRAADSAAGAARTGLADAGTYSNPGAGSVHLEAAQGLRGGPRQSQTFPHDSRYGLSVHRQSGSDQLKDGMISDEPMFERKGEPLLGRWQFVGRMFRALSVATLVVIGSLAMGMAGYHFLGGAALVGGLLNSWVVLTRLGPGDTNI